MIFSDERDLFVSEIEELSDRLANKSANLSDRTNFRQWHLSPNVFRL